MSDQPLKYVDGAILPAGAGDLPGWTPDAPPVAAPVPIATPYQITLALNLQGGGAAFDAAVAKAKPSDRIRWNARTEAIPADNPVYVRLCGLARLDPVPLHASAVMQ